MKVLHICTSDSGGAGLCCCRIHQALLQQGIDSKVLVMEKSSKDNHVIGYGQWLTICRKIFNKLLRMAGLMVTDFNRVFYLSSTTRQCFTVPTSWIDLSNHPLVKEADVIHLHWINGFVDYPSFFKRVQKTFVWTLHDENLFLGICHYQKDKDVASELEKKYYQKKLDYIHCISNLGIVFLSKMMYKQYHGHEMIVGRKDAIINNAVDYHKYHPMDKRESRKHFGLAEDAIVFSFVSASLHDPRKGLNQLVEAVQKLDNPKFKILAVGSVRDYQAPAEVHTTGPIYDAEEMSRAYSCADYFVMPSNQEAFAQTPIEAMACGVPAVVFPVSGTEELIKPENGILCKGFSVEDLVNGIKEALASSYDSTTIRKDTIERFSPESIANQYISFYNEVLKG
jgi:glycosyltransferase involved in cell wall biosynthesis